jgi:hypothetical protein
MNKHVLLLGNGINNVTNNYKWSNLIEDLINYAGLKKIRLDDKKPFPLLYEEIYLTNLKSKKINEIILKTFIAEEIRILRPNDIHRRIRLLDFSDILTTNYDYTIEKIYGCENDELHNEGIVKESLYSVFRHTEIRNTKIWHIHGEINTPKSILLGNEHYGGNLQHIRNYVVQGSSTEYKSFRSPSLVSLIKKNNVKNNSWLDLFFQKDIHIVGLSLDFIELDLWWLITYRARNKLEGKIPINNKITYYYPEEYKNSMRHKLEMFRANEVSTMEIGKVHDQSYYNQLFDYMERKLI